MICLLYIFTFTGFIIILWLIKMVNVCLESWADDNENSNNLLKSKVKKRNKLLYIEDKNSTCL